MKNMLRTAVCAALLLCGISTLAQEQSWTLGQGIQDTGWAGLGNHNELLATACYQIPSSVTVPPQTVQVQYTYTNSNGEEAQGTTNVQCSYQAGTGTFTGGQLDVAYTLSGSWSQYIEKLAVWARPLKGTSTLLAAPAGADDVFANAFDYRAPGQKSGCTLLGETSTVSGSGTIACRQLLEAGKKYLVYLTAWIKDDVELPFIGGAQKNFTLIGGQLTSIAGTGIKGENLEMIGTYSYTTYEKRGKKYHETTATGTSRTTVKVDNLSFPSQAITYPTVSAFANGSRVLVPVRQILLAPGDYYSKFYRIPALGTTSNGTIIAVSDARKYFPHDIANDIDMVVTRCPDGYGRNWSVPFTLVKGTSNKSDGTPCALDAQGVVIDPSTIDASQSIGHGDAAIAALPHGRLLLCMIEGGALSGTSPAQPLTKNRYMVSSNNGAQWSDPKEIPLELYDNTRGCIAPGDMCVPQQSPLLNGFAVGSLRALRHETSGTNDAQHNYFLLYDYTNDTWYNTHDTGNSNAIFYDNDTNGQDDEAQFMEIGNNKLLYSARLNGHNNNPACRNFSLITFTGRNADGSFNYTAKKLNNLSKELFTTAANSAALRWQCPNGIDYYLHTATHYNPNDATPDGNKRTDLRLLMHTLDGLNEAAGTIEWDQLYSLSDPLGARNETAQYSSMTRLRDGSLGVLFEEYPIPAYANSDDGGRDYYLQQVYLQLRPGDILADYVAPTQEEVTPPIITPESQTYPLTTVMQDFADGITYVNPNWTEDGPNLMHCDLYFTDKNGTMHTMLSKDFTTREVHVTLSDILNGTGEIAPADQILESDIADNTKFEAYATATVGNRRSVETDKAYYINFPVRTLLIQAHNPQKSGTGNPTMLASSHRVGVNVPTIVAIGKGVLIEANQASNSDYIQFVNFTKTRLDGSVRVIDNNVEGVTMSGNQITFYLRDTTEWPDNYDTDGDGVADALCIVANYEYVGPAIGLKSQVVSSYHGQMVDTNQPKAGRFDCISRGATDDNLSSNGFSQVVFETLDQALLDADGSEEASYAEQVPEGTLAVYQKKAEESYIPGTFRQDGLHLSVGVLPDASTAAKLDAVILLAVNYNPESQDYRGFSRRRTVVGNAASSDQPTTVSDDFQPAFLTNPDGTPYYILLQGQRPNSALKRGAAKVVDWYTSSGLDAAGHTPDFHAETSPEQHPGSLQYARLTDTSTPLHGVAIYDIDKLGGFPEDVTDKILYVVVNVVGPSFNNVNDLTKSSLKDGTAAFYTMYHPMNLDYAKDPTGVENIHTDPQVLDGEPEYYNLQGMRVDRSQLTPGIYILCQGRTSRKVAIR